ncbi:hypothetical protein NE237_006096 [Protea cynaroides]|uniref:Cytochrome c oxidase copper chaperone n=1 Tax=Protea cynaroides TaxID=273540 RepID=A0A9Q0KLR0_9MAGN|nr:hypothetical protein NE237_006096 [Protea cynaroides]
MVKLTWRPLVVSETVNCRSWNKNPLPTRVSLLVGTLRFRSNFYSSSNSISEAQAPSYGHSNEAICTYNKVATNFLRVNYKVAGSRFRLRFQFLMTMASTEVGMQVHTLSSSEQKQGSSTTKSGSDTKPKKKICCACPDTKRLRDECIVEHGEAACTKWINAHLECLRAEGFNV